jgi:hypothetical protein
MPGLPVRPIHLDDSDAFVLQIPGDADSVGAGALHTNQHQIPMGAEPGDQLTVSMTRRGERFDTENASQVIHHSSDMNISVGVDTTNHSIRVFYDGHCHPSLHRQTGVACTCRTLASTGPEHRPPPSDR